MAKTSDDFLYYVRGRSICIVERDNNDDIVSPVSAIAAGIRFEYSAIPPFYESDGTTAWGATPLDESAILDVDRHLALACVCYVKSKILLDSGYAQGHEYYLKMFKQKVGENQSARNHGLRRIVSGNFGIK